MFLLRQPDSLFLVCLQENLVENKHHKLARSLRSGPTDRDLKPNAHTRDQLNVGTVINIITWYEA